MAGKGKVWISHFRKIIRWGPCMPRTSKKSCEAVLNGTLEWIQRLNVMLINLSKWQMVKDGLSQCKVMIAQSAVFSVDSPFAQMLIPDCTTALLFQFPCSTLSSSRGPWKDVRIKDCVIGKVSSSRAIQIVRCQVVDDFRSNIGRF